METLFIGILIIVIPSLILYYVFGIGKEKRSFSSRFSSTQYIKLLPPSLGGTDYLNLDNVATLQLHIPYDINKITLLLNRIPVIELPPRSQGGFKIEGFKIVSHKNTEIYTFSTSNSTQKIKIGSRIFIITLKCISKIEVKDVPNAIQYEFGITEE